MAKSNRKQKSEDVFLTKRNRAEKNYVKKTKERERETEMHSEYGDFEGLTLRK